MWLVSDVSDGRNASVFRVQHIPVYKELRFKKKKTCLKQSIRS